MARTIYEKYGGFAQINRIVMAFYDALLDSDEIGPYFDEVEMSKLIDHQTKFISSLLGGPASFTDAHLQHAHRNLGITPAHFEEMKAVLGETLADHNVEPDDVTAVLNAVEARRGMVVSA